MKNFINKFDTRIDNMDVGKQKMTYRLEHTYQQDRIAWYLQNGWEPFAVDGNTIWFRINDRNAKPEKMEPPKPTHPCNNTSPVNKLTCQLQHPHDQPHTHHRETQW